MAVVSIYVYIQFVWLLLCSITSNASNHLTFFFIPQIRDHLKAKSIWVGYLMAIDDRANFSLILLVLQIFPNQFSSNLSSFIPQSS